MDSTDVSVELVVSELACGYGKGSRVVHEVSLKAQAASITAILGPNGAGKSTLLKAIVGELTPISGSIRIGDIELTRLETHARAAVGLGYVPQLRSVFPRLTVAENLEIGAYLLSPDNRVSAVHRVYERFPMFAKMRSRLAGALSGGEQRLLGVARAWISGPSVLLLDEPTAALSPVATEAVWRELLELRNEGVALVVVEQRTRKTLEVADWAYVLTSGRNAVDGSPADLQESYDLGAIFMGENPKVRSVVGGGKVGPS